MTKTDNMEWYVYYDEFNQNKIVPLNIFKHIHLIKMSSNYLNWI